MSVRPIVDGIEEEHAGELTVIRLNVQDPTGRDLSEEMDSRYTPTFILFDEVGEIIYRSVGSIDPQVIAALLEKQ